MTDIGRHIAPVGAENIQTKIFNKKLIGNEKKVPPIHFALQCMMISTVSMLAD